MSKVVTGITATPLDAASEDALWCITNDVSNHMKDLKVLIDLLYAIDGNELEESGGTESFLHILELALETIHTKMSNTVAIGSATYNAHKQKSETT